MNDIRRLKNKLSKIGADESRADEATREVHATNTTGLLLAVLHEIDETILARELVFRNDAGQLLGLDVGNRRLLRLYDKSGDADFSTYHPELGRAFSQSDPTLTKAIKDLLQDFIAGSDKLNISSGKVDRPVAPADTGLSAQALAHAWTIDLYVDNDASSARQIEEFISSCHDITVASVEFNSKEILVVSGPEQVTEQLVEIAQDGLLQLDENLKDCFQDAETSFFVVPGLSNDADQSIAYVGCGINRALMMVSSENLTDINSVWRQLNY